MANADKVLLPPPLPSEPDERGSARRLDEIGVETVLGAMIEQKRRASSPGFDRATLELAQDLARARAEDGAEAHDEDESDPPPKKSDAFLKKR